MDKSPGKTTLPVLALALLAVLAFTSLPMLAAKSKADKQSSALVAALQAVSPDPLGGQLGLVIAASAETALTKGTNKPATQQASTVQHFERAYANWKAGAKS